MIAPDKYRKPMKNKPRLFILKWTDTDSSNDEPYYVQVEGDLTYLTTSATKATVFSYAEGEIFRFRWGRDNFRMIPRYSEVKRYVDKKEKVEVNMFWKKSVTVAAEEQTESSVCDIEPKIEVETPAIFKKADKQETVKKFWQ